MELIPRVRGDSPFAKAFRVGDYKFPRVRGDRPYYDGAFIDRLEFPRVRGDRPDADLQMAGYAASPR